jgi:hypothetical protein
MVAYASDARDAIGRCRVTARYSVESLRRMAVQTAPCFGCHRQRVRVDLMECPRCHQLVCDTCLGRCFCHDSQRVTDAARDLGAECAETVHN